MATYDISSDSDLYSYVRALTQYEDTSDELPQTELSTIAEATKLRVHSKFGSDNWYSDRGLGLVLLGMTCVQAKASVENFSISGWTFGGGNVSVDVSNAGDADQIQFEQYTSIAQEGVQASSETSSSPLATNINSANYIGDT